MYFKEPSVVLVAGKKFQTNGISDDKTEMFTH